ncbi:hypothetical protein [Lacticaseibacillus hulanensis]|uniref:hypothetical protein n=1 Tax=Lacticaseibacillus hulanensis TaxID=2493111 RepID=UPI0013E367DC|nr:hypothetical protein [Lacticaseibacillus hulanensis]
MGKWIAGYTAIFVVAMAALWLFFGKNGDVKLFLICGVVAYVAGLIGTSQRPRK